MSSYPPPTIGWDLGEFNPTYFTWADASLTLSEADLRYLLKSGGIITGSLTISDTINATTYKLSGATMDFSAITSITNGTAAANKALVLDANRDITNIRNLTCTGSLTSTGQALNGVLSSTQGWIDTSSAFRITSGNTPTYGNGIGMRFSGIAATGYLSSHNHQLGTHNRIDIQDHLIYITSSTDTPADAIGFNTTTPRAKWDFDMGSNTANKLRISYTNNSVYSELYADSLGYMRMGNVVVNTLNPNANLNACNGVLYCDYTNGRVGIYRTDPAYRLDVTGQQRITYAGNNLLTLLNTNTTSQTNMIMDNGTVNMEIGLRGSADGIPSSFYVFSNSAMRMTIDNAGKFSLGDIRGNKWFNIMSNSDSSIRMGRAESINNAFTIQYNHVASGSDFNNVSFDPYGASGRFVVQANGECAFSTTPTNATITVAAGNNVDIGGTSSIRQLNNSGLFTLTAPLTITSVSLRCYGNIHCDGSSLYCSSDRRLKENIRPITDEEAERFVDEVEPVRFNWKDKLKPAIGYIAQDVLAANFGEIVDFMLDEDMDEEDDGFSISGVRFNLDYSKIVVLLHKRLRMLIDEVAVLREELEHKRS